MKRLALISLAAAGLVGCNVESAGGATEPTATPTPTPAVSTTPTVGSVEALTFNDSNLEACVDATGVTEIADLTSLTCINQGITDASDIGDLFALQTLNLSRNPLTSINVSNMPLTYLNVSNLAGQGTLGSISLTGLEQLEILNVSGNQLTSLTTSSSPNLSEIAFAYNQLSSVNFSANGQLAVLHGQHNQLNSVTVANGPLTDVDLSNNQLNDIDFPQPYSLRVANLSNNLFFDFPDWSADQRDETRNLETLNLANNSLSSLAMPNVVQALILDGNRFTSWAPAANETLTTLSMDNNQLTSITLPAGLETVSLASNQLGTLGTVPSTVTWLDISDNLFASLNLSGNTNLRSLNVSDNSFDRFAFPSMPEGLTTLNIARNAFIAANPNRFANLENLTVDGNSLTVLDVDLNTELVSLSAESTTLSDLVLTENTKLKTLKLTNNQFSSVNPPSGEGLTLNDKQSYSLVDLSQNSLPAEEITELGTFNITTLITGDD